MGDLQMGSTGEPHISPRTEEVRDEVVATGHELAAEARRGWRSPGVGAALAGGAGLAVGAMFGVTEAIIAGASAYAVFRLLKPGNGKHDPLALHGE